MSTTVTYKGNQIAEVNNDTKTLLTAGKYMEADVLLTDVTQGGTIKPRVLRHDAELVQTWSYDKQLNRDESITIPSYTTTATSLKASATLATPTLNFNDYNYFVTARAFTNPVYSTTTPVKGRQEYTFTSSVYEIVVVRANTGKALSQNKYATAVSSSLYTSGTGSRCLYWSSTSAVSWYTAVTYGASQSIVAPTLSSSTLTINSPSISIRGSSTYLTSAAWANITDVRAQYIIELWRVPYSADKVSGWQTGSGFQSMLNDVINNGGTLT